MKVLDPRQEETPELPDAEALIKEARRRQRRRWFFIGMAVLVLAAASATGAVLSRRTHKMPPPVATKGPVPPASLARCTVQSLSVETLGIQTEMGWNYQAFLVHNFGPSRCNVPAGQIALRPHPSRAGGGCSCLMHGKLPSAFVACHRVYRTVTRQSSSTVAVLRASQLRPER
jgi:hypothetical protein